MRNACKSVSPTPSDLFCRFCWNDSACLPYAYGSLPLPATTTQLFSRSLSSHSLCIFAAVLKLFLPLTTSEVSGTTNSNKSAPTHFAAGTIYLRKNGYAVLPITCASAPNPRPRCLPTPQEWNLYFS